MKLPEFRYHRPARLDEALALLDAFGPDAKVLAGGQSLLPLLALRLARPAHLVDLAGVGEFAGIERTGDGGVLVGAAVRHAAAEDSAVLRADAPLVAEATPLIGHRAIRNRGTVCGSLAHADPAAELPAVMLAVEAEMLLRRAGRERTVPAGRFFSGFLTSALDDGELLTGVRLPAWPAGAGWSIREVSRRHGDYALVGLAAVLGVGDGGRIERAALSFFGAASTPVRVSEAEAALVGEEPDEDLFAEAAAVVVKALDPPSDIHATAAYRAHVAGVLTRRCLSEAARRTEAAA